jgi:hypothetical protein
VKPHDRTDYDRKQGRSPDCQARDKLPREPPVSPWVRRPAFEIGWRLIGHNPPDNGQGRDDQQQPIDVIEMYATGTFHGATLARVRNPPTCPASPASRANTIRAWAASWLS